MKRLVWALAAVAITSSVVLPLQASAQVSVSVNIGTAPPPLRYERVPPPRNGYVWAPGYWNWNGYQHVWAQGHWVTARPGYVYHRPEWRQDHGRWYLDNERWQPSRHDRHHYKDKHYKDKHHRDDHGYHCPPGQAKKGNC